MRIWLKDALLRGYDAAGDQELITLADFAKLVLVAEKTLRQGTKYNARCRCRA